MGVLGCSVKMVYVSVYCYVYFELFLLSLGQFPMFPIHLSLLPQALIYLVVEELVAASGANY